VRLGYLRRSARACQARLAENKEVSDIDIETRVRTRAFVVWTYVGLLTLVAIIYAGLKFLLPALVPFIYAIVIVYLVKPAFEFLCGLRVPRIVALVLSYLALFAIVALFSLVMIPAFVDQGKQLAAELPAITSRVESLIANVERYFVRVEIPSWAREAISASGRNVVGWVSSVAARIPEAGVNLASGILNVVLAIFLSFYILKDWNRIRSSLFGFLRDRGREDLVILLRKGNIVLSGFIRGQLLVATSVGLLTAIALSLMGVNFAFLLGMLTGVLDLIPYFGPVIGGLLAFLVALTESPTLALWVIVVMIAIQQIESILLAPHIMSSRVEVHPALVVFAFLVGGLTFGIIGLLMAIPVAAFAKAVFVQYYVESGEFTNAQQRDT